MNTTIELTEKLTTALRVKLETNRTSILLSDLVFYANEESNTERDNNTAELRGVYLFICGFSLQSILAICRVLRDEGHNDYCDNLILSFFEITKQNLNDNFQIELEEKTVQRNQESEFQQFFAERQAEREIIEKENLSRFELAQAERERTKAELKVREAKEKKATEFKRLTDAIELVMNFEEYEKIITMLNAIDEHIKQNKHVIESLTNLIVNKDTVQDVKRATGQYPVYRPDRPLEVENVQGLVQNNTGGEVNIRVGR